MEAPKRVRITVNTQNDVSYIGRQWNLGGYHLKKSKWFNPYTVKKYGLDECLKLYEEYLKSKPELLKQLPELSGKTIACFCETGNKCHGDVLIRVGREVGYW